jgi:BarA-like signal transduction histidine kinase
MADVTRGNGTDDLFEYHAPSSLQLIALQKLRASCKAHYDLILATLPPSRERSLAITKLEETSMWENKACVFSEPNE